MATETLSPDAGDGAHEHGGQQRRAALRRAANREREAGKVLGVPRVHRARGERAPDVAAVELPGGAVLGPEVKTRKRLPRLLVAALEQARGYFPRAIPLAVVSELGGRALAVLDLRAFAALVGLDVGALPGPRRRRRRGEPVQLDLLDLLDVTGGGSGAGPRRGAT